MATYKQGILGSFSGKVGNVVGSSWRGVAYMRSLAKAVRNPRTAAQTETRNTLAAVASRLKFFAPAIRAGFPTIGNIGGWNAAVKVNRTHVTKQEDGTIELLPANFALSMGTNLWNAAVSIEGTNLTAAWGKPKVDNPLYGGQIYVCVYNATTQTGYCFSADLDAAELTADLTGMVNPDSDTAHTYYFAAKGDYVTAQKYVAP